MISVFIFVTNKLFLRMVLRYLRLLLTSETSFAILRLLGKERTFEGRIEISIFKRLLSLAAPEDLWAFREVVIY